MTGIPAGDLRYQVGLWRFVTETDPMGGDIKTWSTLGDRRADIIFGTGRERREAAQTTASVTATFSVRSDPLTLTLTPADRLRYADADWDISSIVPSRKYDAVLDITATRRTA